MADTLQLSVESRLQRSGILQQAKSSRSFKAKSKKKGDYPYITSAAFSIDGRYLALGRLDRTIELWDVISKEKQQVLEGHTDRINSVGFSTRNYLASESKDKTIKIWHITGKGHQTLKGHGCSVQSVAFSADGQCLASVSYDTITIWDTRTGKEQRTIKVVMSRTTSIAVSIDSQFFAFAKGETIKIRDMITGKEHQTLRGRSGVSSAETGSISLNVEYNPTPISIATNSIEGRCDNRLIASNTQIGNDVGYGISLDTCWNTWNGHGMMWLPPEYRSHRPIIRTLSTSTSSQSPMADVIIALGSSSFKLVMMRLSSEPYSTS